MRLVVWNCQGGLHDKWSHLVELRPDIAIVPESAEPEVVAAKLGERAGWSDVQWVGAQRHKGLAVYAFNGYTLTRDRACTGERRWLLPLQVCGVESFRLLAVWDFEYDSRWSRNVSGKRPGQIELALEELGWLQQEGRAVVAGDFNNPFAWEKQTGLRSITKLSRYLMSRGLVSAYHYTHDVPVGEEQHMTYWQHRKDAETLSFHIDHIFVPAEWMHEGGEFSLGTHAEWCVEKAASDHAPLVLDTPSRAAKQDERTTFDPDTAIAPLLPYLAVFEREGFAASEWLQGEPMQMPFEALHPAVRDFEQLLYKLGWVYPFDWGKWHHGDGRAYVENPEAERHADLDTCRKLLTCYARANHFSDGAFTRAITQGSIPAILRRLQEIWEERQGYRQALGAEVDPGR